jgi:hypothetical protein
VVLSSFDGGTGKAGRARSIIGVASFDGRGNCSFGGALMDTRTGSKAQAYTVSGTYSAGANGLFQIQNPINTQYTEYGGIGAAGPSAFVASATEGIYNDVLVGIPMPTGLSVSTLTGTYRAGYIDYLQGDVTQVRNSIFTLTPNGQGSMGTLSVTGYAANLGSTSLSQSVFGATYSVDAATGTGNLILGAASSSQLVSGAKQFVPSKDGSILLGGDGNGFDLLVAVRPFSGSNANASFAGLYYYAQLSDDASGLPAASVSTPTTAASTRPARASGWCTSVTTSTI